MANISCSFLPLSCSSNGSYVIRPNIPITIHPSSGLAAYFLGAEGWTWRVYFADTSGQLNQLDGDSSWTNNWEVLTLQQGRMINGSAISVSVALTIVGVNVFYVDNLSKTLATAVYNISNDHGDGNRGFQQTGRITFLEL